MTKTYLFLKVEDTNKLVMTIYLTLSHYVSKKGGDSVCCFELRHKNAKCIHLKKSNKMFLQI